ncbi:MAG TPA: hypothetical protein ENK91_05555 [Bacteroidetes bacterium]|nr:hypothetical protein [Bacteroidota bacterium]
MKKLLIFLIIALPLLFSSCAKHLVSNFQDSSENTGKIVVIPNKPVYHMSLTMQNKLNDDNKLIILNSNIKTLAINNVPEGMYLVEYSYNNNNLLRKKSNSFSVTVNKDKTTTKLIQLPPPSPYSYVVWATIVLALLFLPPGPHN